MSNVGNGRHRGEELDDPFVRRAYRELATEPAPALLDQAVQAQARTALEAKRPRFGAWTRPLAWAASIGLCVAIALEVTLAPSPADLPAAAPTTRAADLHEAAVELRARKLGEAQHEKSGPAPGTFTTSNDGNAAPDPAGDGTRPDDRVGDTATRTPSDGGLRRCSEKERSDPVAWRRCISALQAAGDTEPAAAELELLEETYPGHAPAR